MTKANTPRYLHSVLAIDPGGTTGLFYDGQIGGERVQVFEHVAGDDHHKALWERLTRYHASAHASGEMLTILCEKFEYKKSEQGREKIDYVSKEYEGVVKLFAQQNTSHHLALVLQGSSYTVGKSAFWGDGVQGNAKIKQLGLWQPGMKHALDALRHYLYWVSFTTRNTYFINQLVPEDRS